ncbi:glutamine synthetase family protein [Hasllibacter sp. MH4015]|uniref:glutamine synthetase family protein n=1 Tax=Hasllibacter sp. MH4015 TaxID=2854029 RepID=UPI001CD67D09|nr:glutamine synthetase family protein [Hasllibacter sp. MH4015]
MTTEDILRQVEKDGIETIRVVFTDPHGVLRGKTVTASALPGVLRDGLRVPSTLLLKDLSHRTAFPVWAGEGAPMQGASDVMLWPDPATFRRLPWSPHSALIHCDVSTMLGVPVAFSSREVLRRAEGALVDVGGMSPEAMRSVPRDGKAHLNWGATPKVGVEIEFQVFRVLDPSLSPDQSKMPGQPPQVENTTQGYQYLTETRYAEVEPMLDRLRRAAEEMGIDVRSVEVEMGPSQYEVTFAPGSPMDVAEQAVNFRMLAKELSHRHGMLASFMPKPALPNAVANGWHIHQSIGGFKPESARAMHWIAGLLEHAPACALLTNPTVNSYKRFTPYQLAPTRIGWARDNRGAMVRALLDDTPASRVENRLPDSAANPYFALAAQLISGRAGLKAAQAPPPEMTDPYGGDAPVLPASLGAAIEAFAASDTLRDALTPEVHDWLVTLKRHEWNRYLAHISDWEQAEYFTAL